MPGLSKDSGLSLNLAANIHLGAPAGNSSLLRPLSDQIRRRTTVYYVRWDACDKKCHASIFAVSPLRQTRAERRASKGGGHDRRFRSETPGRGGTG